MELEKLINNDDIKYLTIPTHVNQYPQGKENCINLVKEAINNGGKIHILKRKTNYSKA